MWGPYSDKEPTLYPSWEHLELHMLSKHMEDRLPYATREELTSLRDRLSKKLGM